MKIARFKFWILIVGVSFALANIFIDEFFNAFWVITAWIWLGLFITLLVFSIRCIVKSHFKKYLSLCFTFLAFSIYNPALHYVQRLFESPIVLQAYLSGERSGIGLTLRKNNRYEIESFSFFGASEKSKGDYKLLDKKIIFLDENRIETWLPDTLYINDNKITFRFDKNKKPDTSSGNAFNINIRNRNN